jgi:PPM family protein phosphatase
MKIVPGNAQHIGSRAEQQDDFGFSRFHKKRFVTHGGIMATLTDGMGGMAMGREAGRTAKAAMLKAYQAKSPQESIPQALTRSLQVANEAVVALARDHGLEGEIGTTMVAAVIKGKELYWVSVGDSRIYLYRRGRLTQLTADHDYGQELAEMVVAGELTQEEAMTHPQRRALTSFLGLSRLREVDHRLSPYYLEIGDRILLCSDGLYNTLGEDEIAAALDHEPQAAAEELVNEVLAREKARQDNVTIAILGCGPDGPDLGNRLKSMVSPKVLVLAVILALLSISSWALWSNLHRGARSVATKPEKISPAGKTEAKAPVVPVPLQKPETGPPEPLKSQTPPDAVSAGRAVSPAKAPPPGTPVEPAVKGSGPDQLEKGGVNPPEKPLGAGSQVTAPDKKSVLPAAKVQGDPPPSSATPAVPSPKKPPPAKKNKPRNHPRK